MDKKVCCIWQISDSMRSEISEKCRNWDGSIHDLGREGTRKGQDFHSNLIEFSLRLHSHNKCQYDFKCQIWNVLKTVPFYFHSSLKGGWCIVLLDALHGLSLPGDPRGSCMIRVTTESLMQHTQAEYLANLDPCRYITGPCNTSSAKATHLSFR